MSDNGKKLDNAINSRSIPICVLDNKWHKIFNLVEKTPSIEDKEKQISDMLKRQGQLNTDSTKVKNLKKKLVDELAIIVHETGKDAKVEENKRLIDECNEKLDAYQDELLDLPKEIALVNKQLMRETMDICYDVMHENVDSIKELNDWIKDIRIQLKTNIVIKQEKEMANAQLYSYMHNVFGADAMDMFDLENDPLEKIRQLKAIKDEAKERTL